MTTGAAQPPLFVESTTEALRAAVAAVGGAKIVGPQLWPHKPADEAARALLDALNPERPHKLDPDQVIFLLRKAREIGYHGAIEYFCAEAGYTRPSPIEPADEAAQLQRDFIAAVKASQQIAARLERLGTPLARVV